jgi:hypothetical protein
MTGAGRHSHAQVGVDTVVALCEGENLYVPLLLICYWLPLLRRGFLGTVKHAWGCLWGSTWP